MSLAEQAAAVASIEGVEGNVDSWASQSGTESDDGSFVTAVASDCRIVAIDPSAGGGRPVDELDGSPIDLT